MHRYLHNFTLRRGISEVNSPTIRSDDRRARVLQGRPQALGTGLEPGLETIQRAEFLPRQQASLRRLSYGRPRDPARAMMNAAIGATSPRSNTGSVVVSGPSVATATIFLSRGCSIDLPTLAR